ncbi:MAG: ATPase, T2SS/T4P/T4SS family [Desulfovibrionaceae bacterium]|nr:ATPase, T2SS/T4P/T4SS family [Desulfovibrionaceae bacterium]
MAGSARGPLADEDGFAEEDAWQKSLPPALAARARFEGNKLHLSADLRGSEELDLYLAMADRLQRAASQASRASTDSSGREAKDSFPELVWHSRDSFEKRFGVRLPDTDPQGPGRQGRPENWVHDYVRELFARARDKKASDIHIACMGSYATVSFRRMGFMTDEEVLDGEKGLMLIRAIFQGQISQTEGGFSLYERQDGRIAGSSFLPEGLYAVRLHSEPVQDPHGGKPGVVLAMRLLFDAADTAGSMEERLTRLGFAKEQQALLQDSARLGGMTIISGPTGHGKTTVLKNIMESMAHDTPTRSYYSLEDPPEYPIRGVHQLNVLTKSVSDDERRRAFMEALAGLMRSDPDVILLGEVRYREAAEAAVQAALTGHSIWTTVHAGSALSIITRLHEMGLPYASICAENVLTALTYQRLVPVLCPHCKISLQEHPEEVQRLPQDLVQRLKHIGAAASIPEEELMAKICLRGPGCPACSHMGLAGQKVAAEAVSLREPVLRSLLREGREREARLYWRHTLHGRTYLDQARERVLSGEADPVLSEERLGTTLDADLDELKAAFDLPETAGSGSTAKRTERKTAKKTAQGTTRKKAATTEEESPEEAEARRKKQAAIHIAIRTRKQAASQSSATAAAAGTAKAAASGPASA